MGIGPIVDVSVGAVTDTGPCPVNADRFFASRSPVDGSWVIAVADGVGGHPEAPDAAQAAVEGLPERVGSLDAMGDAFVAASERVAVLAPSRDDFWAAERAECGDTVFDLMVGWHRVRPVLIQSEPGNRLFVLRVIQRSKPGVRSDAAGRWTMIPGRRSKMSRSAVSILAGSAVSVPKVSTLIDTGSSTPMA